jgi:hypothetical protein
MSCPDLCTAAKCEELENSIVLLNELVSNLINTVNFLTQENTHRKQEIENLTLKIEDHIKTKINGSGLYAHEYEPDFLIEFGVDKEPYYDVFKFKLILEGKTKEDYAYLQRDVAGYSLDATIVGKELLISLYFQGLDTKIAYVELPFTYQSDFDNHIITNVNDGSNDAHQYNPTLTHSLNVNNDFEGYYTLVSKIIFGNGAQSTITAEDYAFIPKPDGIINIGGSVAGKYLYLTVATASHTDTATIYLPIDEEITNIFNNNYNETMTCDLTPVLLAISTCCQELKTEIDQNQALIDSLIYQIELRTGEIKTLSELISSKLDFEFSGQALTNLTCEFETDNDGDIIPTYALSEYDFISYQYIGFQGIHELLKVIINNQTILHDTACKTVSPPFNLNLQDSIEKICEQEGLLTQGDFPESENYQDYLLDILLSKLNKSVTRFLIKKMDTVDGTNGFVVSTNLDWTIGHLIDRTINLESQTLKKVCEEQEQDVVAIVASDTVIENVKDKQLILHFVELANYPKRTSNSNYRPVQIPLPKTSFDWVEDFEDLRWTTGNFYAKLWLKNEQDRPWKTPITGYFANQDRADSYFNQILDLTTLIEDYRTYHPTTKSRNFVTRETRPYRAFVVSIDNFGNPECQTKYVPIIT